MIFRDDLHEKFYNENIAKTKAHDDPYRQALFYTLGLLDETRRHIKSLYDFKERGIDFDGLFGGWQTSTSKKVTRMAFNLYNGFAGHTGEEEIDKAENYSPYELFDNSLMVYFFEAVKLRYRDYYRMV